MNAKAIIVLQKGTLALIALLLVVAAASANPAPVVLGNLAAVVATQQSDEEDGPNTGGRKVKRTPTMRENVYRQLSEAQQAAEAEDMTTAKRIVQDLREDSNLTSYERAQVFNFLGYIHYSEGNYSAAINAYEQVIAQPDIPEGMQTQILYSIAQLSFAEEDYAKAEEYLLRWMDMVPNPKADAYMLLGQTRYAREDYKGALQPIERGIALAREAGEQVKEQWLLLLRAIYYEMNNFEKVAEILEELILKYPNKSYWIQLSGIYGELEQPQKRLITLELAYKQGMLDKEQEYLNLAQLLMQQDMPYRGATILAEGFERGIIARETKNLRLLAQAYMLAQEEDKAIPPLKAAAESSSDGELYLQLANAYMNQGMDAESEQAAEQALAKNTDRAGDAWFLIGMARFNQDKLTGAQEAFRNASRDDGNERAARQWLSYIEKEKERRDQLAAALDS